MTVSKAQSLAVLKYRAKAYDRLSTDVPKGKRDAYNLAAKELKISLATLIQCGVEEYIVNHGGEISAPRVDTMTADQKRLVDEFSKLPADVQNQLMRLVKAINSAQPAHDREPSASTDRT